MAALTPPDPPLQAAGLLLRLWRPEDQPRLYTAFSDPDVQRFSWAAPHAYTEDDTAAYLRATRAGQLAGRELQWALVTPDDDQLLGCASLYDINRDRGTAAVGYWLVRAARGRGLATTAVRLVSSWAFDVLGVQRLELTCAPDNTASQAVAARAGFQLEGWLRSHLPFRGGRRDTLLHSLLPTDRT